MCLIEEAFYSEPKSSWNLAADVFIVLLSSSTHLLSHMKLWKELIDLAMVMSSLINY